MYVSEAVKSRFSCRAFTEKPVSKELIKEILDVAKQAPSGGNLQPWHIHAISGKKLDQIVSDIESKITDMPMGKKRNMTYIRQTFGNLIEVDALNVAKIYTKA